MTLTNKFGSKLQSQLCSDHNSWRCKFYDDEYKLTQIIFTGMFASQLQLHASSHNYFRVLVQFAKYRLSVFLFLWKLVSCKADIAILNVEEEEVDEIETKLSAVELALRPTNPPNPWKQELQLWLQLEPIDAEFPAWVQPQMSTSLHTNTKIQILKYKY